MHPVLRYGFIVEGMDELLTTDACTMATAERPFRLAEFDALFASSVRRVERLTDDSVRLHLDGSRGLRAKVQDLTDRESSCCSFFTFDIDGDDDGLTVDVAVPPVRREILDGLAARATELSS